MSAATKARPATQLAALIRELEKRGVTMWLDGSIVRWRGRMTPRLLDEARDQREAIIDYLHRRCASCGQSRLVMVEMESNGAAWWLCAECWVG